MALDLGQILLLIISLLGVILNGLVGGVVTVGLGLQSPDLVLIAIISIVDLLFYINNIVRMSLMGIGTIQYEPGLLTSFSKSYTWCSYDAIVSFITTQSAIELVAILGFMRYKSICQQKRYPMWVWYAMVAFSLLLSLALSMVTHHYGFYGWSSTKQFCLSTIDTEGSNAVYFVASFALYIVRFAFSLSVLTFCYYKVMAVYHDIIAQSGVIALKSNDDLNDGTGPYMSHKNNVNTMPYYGNDKNNGLSTHNPKVQKQKTMTTLKLMGATFTYIFCHLPDMIMTILFLAGSSVHPSPEAILFTNSVLTCSGLVNAFFVILSHDPSRRYISQMIDSISSR